MALKHLGWVGVEGGGGVGVVVVGLQQGFS